MTQPPTDELAQWRWQADRRWNLVRELLPWPSAPDEIIAENIHQALERYFKWFLLARGWNLAKTHDLLALLREARQHNASLGQFAALCDRVNTYYVEDRYPHMGMDTPTREELQADFTEADQLIKLLTTGN